MLIAVIHGISAKPTLTQQVDLFNSTRLLKGGKAIQLPPLPISDDAVDITHIIDALLADVVAEQV